MNASARGALAWTLALLALACARAPLDRGALEARHPALRGIGSHGLEQITPYVLPRADTLHWFVCRWDTQRPLRVALPEGLAPRDRELLTLALDSLASAGLALRFDSSAAPQQADIVLEQGPVDPSKSGRTAADCAVRLEGERLSAQLVRAEVTLQRSNQSVTGKTIALSEAEWVGAAVHELGHALGFQGHVSGGSGVMVRNVEQVRAIGRKLLRGEALDAPELRALYALPSGALLRRDALPPGRTAALDRLEALARERGYRGPIVRVGDASALIDWRHPDGRLVGVWLPALQQVLREPARLQISPDPVAEAWLAGTRAGP